jgi:long-chain fatty acid transport protein
MRRFGAVSAAAIAALTSGFLIPGSASAAGFYLQEQSVQGLGRAYSGEAADTGAQSLWWNPATIANVQGVELYGGLSGVFSNSELNDHGSTIQRPGQATTSVGGNLHASNPLEAGLVPSFDAAWRQRAL